MKDDGTPTARDLAELLDAGGAPCVSIYAPTHRASAEIRQDPIRFKNLIREAARSLEERGLRRDDADELLAPARGLVDDRDFWRHQKDGLAWFASGEANRVWRLPFAVPERALVADYFLVRPLLPLLNRDGRYYVLALSQGRITLYEGRHDALQEKPLPGAPSGLEDVLAFVAGEKSLQFHTGTASGAGAVRGGRSAVFHGQGEPDAKHKERVFELFRALDRALGRALEGESTPLVPAGEERTVEIFREACTYRSLTEATIAGNPDHLGADDLVSAARAIVEPIFDRARARAVERYAEAASKKAGTNDPRRIARAAEAGLVDTLLVDVEGDQDVLERAIVRTLQHGGAVFGVPADELPGGGAAGAILRPGSESV